MPKLDQEDARLRPLTNQDVPSEHDGADDSDVAGNGTPSEVAMRINLLGKLIVPPSVSR